MMLLEKTGKYLLQCYEIIAKSHEPFSNYELQNLQHNFNKRKIGQRKKYDIFTIYFILLPKCCLYQAPLMLQKKYLCDASKVIEKWSFQFKKLGHVKIKNKMENLIRCIQNFLSSNASWLNFNRENNSSQIMCWVNLQDDTKVFPKGVRKLRFFPSVKVSKKTYLLASVEYLPKDAAPFLQCYEHSLISGSISRYPLVETYMPAPSDPVNLSDEYKNDETKLSCASNGVNED